MITSNRTRDVHDALKRRCLYYWIDYPTFEKELEIVNAEPHKRTSAIHRQDVEANRINRYGERRGLSRIASLGEHENRSDDGPSQRGTALRTCSRSSSTACHSRR